jgi:uncharacterized protein
MAFCFVADNTLGKLAKWLRMLGFDTTLGIDSSAEMFYDRLEKDRIVLTRTKAIKKQISARRLIFIRSNYIERQLKQVIVEIDIRPLDTRPFSRCTHCNIPIVVVNRDDVYGLIPDYIYETHSEFYTCSQCHRIFWPGSHTKRALKRIAYLFE